MWPTTPFFFLSLLSPFFFLSPFSYLVTIDEKEQMLLEVTPEIDVAHDSFLLSFSPFSFLLSFSFLSPFSYLATIYKKLQVLLEVAPEIDVAHKSNEQLRDLAHLIGDRERVDRVVDGLPDGEHRVDDDGV